MKVKSTEKKEKGKNKKRKVIIIICVFVVIIALVVAGILLGSRFRKGNQFGGFPFGNMQSGGNTINVTGDMLAASGVTSVGVTTESFEVENLTTSLKIKEVYISSEDTITKGTKVLALSEESIEEAREELEQNLKDTELAYRAGTIEYEQSKITTLYDRDSTLLSGEQAKAVYDETLSGLSASVDRAREELNQAKADIAEYQSYVNNDSYRSYFKVDEYQAVYDKTLKALMDKMEEWGVSWPQVTGQGGGAGMGNNTPGSGQGNESGTGKSPSSDQIQVLASLYDVLELQRKDWDQAESDYQNALNNAALELQTLKLQLPELENTLIEAEKNYKNQLLQAELTYQTSLTNAQSAESDYETAIEQAETTYEALKKEWEDAKENLELFENSVGDGFYYASGEGSVLRVMARVGQSLTSEGTIFMYRNPEKVTVTVSVDQTGISKVALNDPVYIQSSEFGGFKGTVIEINPVSASESRTNVSYEVTVQFSGNAGQLGSNESVTVIFGMDEETIENMLSGTEETGKEEQEVQQGGQFPGGFNGGEMPEGFTPGEMPEGGQFPGEFNSGERPERGQKPTNGLSEKGMNEE